MNLHYYGKLDKLESCYTFQKIETKGRRLYIQNSPRFGYEPATMTINNPALFVEDGAGFHRFVIEDFKVDVKDGKLQIIDGVIREIVEGLKQVSLK